MALQSARLFENIIMYLSILRYVFKSRTKKGLYDLNIQAEPFFREVLNIIYDWDLKNLNSQEKNFPAIDLGDGANKICVQVTAENTSAKIEKTITSFCKNKLYRQYDRLIVLLLTDKKIYTKKFYSSDKLSFSVKKDIKDIDDLLGDIEALPISKLERLHGFLEKELQSIVSIFVERDSLLSKAQFQVGLPPQNAREFLDFLKYKKAEHKGGLDDLIKFYNVLILLSKEAREYLFAILWYGECKRMDSSHIYHTVIRAKKLENMLRLSRSHSLEQYKILEDADLVQSLEEEQTPTLSAFFLMETEVELMGKMKEFSGDKEKLLKLIVECDFTSLDRS